MGVCGIVAEYNPLHDGHVRHMAETRRMLGAETELVVVMSGNFVQRGDFALLDKYARAEAAVRAGADLVLELPFPFSLGSADRFAFGAAAVLAGFGFVDSISFGCESGDVELLKDVAAAMETEDYREKRQTHLDAGRSFAEACSLAAESCVGPEGKAALRRPGDTLGVAYIAALGRMGASIRPVAVKREGAAHDSEAEGERYLSASLVRKKLLAGARATELPIPAAMADLWEQEERMGRAPVTMERAERAILGRLRLLERGDYAALPDMAQGLDNRLLRSVAANASLAAMAEAARTRRYSLARVRRSLLHACLGVCQEDFEGSPLFALALAFNRRGRALLRRAGGEGTLPLLTRPAAARDLGASAWNRLKRDIRADAFYALGRPDISKAAGDEGYKRVPAFVDE